MPIKCIFFQILLGKNTLFNGIAKGWQEIKILNSLSLKNNVWLVIFESAGNYLPTICLHIMSYVWDGKLNILLSRPPSYPMTMNKTWIGLSGSRPNIQALPRNTQYRITLWSATVMSDAQWRSSALLLLPLMQCMSCYGKDYTFTVLLCLYTCQIFVPYCPSPCWFPH